MGNLYDPDPHEPISREPDYVERPSPAPPAPPEPPKPPATYEAAYFAGYNNGRADAYNKMFVERVEPVDLWAVERLYAFPFLAVHKVGELLEDGTFRVEGHTSGCTRAVRFIYGEMGRNLRDQISTMKGALESELAGVTARHTERLKATLPAEVHAAVLPAEKKK